MSRHKKFSSVGNNLTDDINVGNTYKTKRKITKIAIHCSASPQGRGDDAHTIDNWHKQRWNSGIGYHYVVLEDGTIQKGRWADYLGAGVSKGNVGTLHICYIGGIKFDDITTKQECSVITLARLLKQMYNLDESKILGHNQFKGHESRGCPLIDMNKLRNNI